MIYAVSIGHLFFLPFGKTLLGESVKVSFLWKKNSVRSDAGSILLLRNKHPASERVEVGLPTLFWT